MNGKFKLGQRVLVHQLGGLKSVEYEIKPIIGPPETHSRFEPIPHDCSDPKGHWVSRVIGWSDFHHMPKIATSTGTVSGKKNPNHCEWPYGEDCLTLLDEAQEYPVEKPWDEKDWALSSSVKIGDTIQFVWPNDIHFPKGDVVSGSVIVPHIESEDWYVGVVVPDEWLFHIVVNESEFKL